MGEPEPERQRPRTIEAAKRLLEAEGSASLNFRRLADEVGVSHAAPLAHFPDRVCLDASIAADCFRDLSLRVRNAAKPERRPASLLEPLLDTDRQQPQPAAPEWRLASYVRGPNPAIPAASTAAAFQPKPGINEFGDRLIAASLAYLRFALEHPGLYRAMYSPNLAEELAVPAPRAEAVERLRELQAEKRKASEVFVELVALDNAEIKYSTVQNWYAGDEKGVGGIYNFVTKRGLCKGVNSKISWTQVETGSAITWKYPSCVLLGDNSIGEFYSVALTNHHQQADTGTKMTHIGRNTRSRIVSKGISAGQSNNSYRGLVKIGPRAENARNYSQCDSMLIGSKSGANTFPYIQVQNDTGKVEHEATTSRIGEEQLFYFASRGIGAEEAVSMIINGFCRDVFQQLPMEFAVEATKLLGLKLEGSVG